MEQYEVTLETAKRMCRISSTSIVLMMGCAAAGGIIGREIFGHTGLYIGAAVGVFVAVQIEMRLIAHRLGLSVGILMMCYGMHSGGDIEPLMNRALSAYKALRGKRNGAWLRRSAEAPCRQLLKGLNALAATGCTNLGEIKTTAEQLLGDLEAIASDSNSIGSCDSIAPRMVKLYVRSKTFSSLAIEWALSRRRRELAG